MRNILLGVVVATLAGAPVLAQGPPRGSSSALHGDSKVFAGRPARFRGIAYKVRGLAELHALPAGQVRARYKTDAEAAAAMPWQLMQTDARGFFQIDVPIPEESPGSSSLRGKRRGWQRRSHLTFPLTVERPWIFELVTDRSLYEPGETVTVWGRLRDQRSRRPLSQKAMTFTSWSNDP